MMLQSLPERVEPLVIRSLGLIRSVDAHGIGKNVVFSLFIQ